MVLTNRYSYMSDSYSKDLLKQAIDEYDPNKEKAYITALKANGTLLKIKYGGGQIATPLPHTPEVPSNTKMYNLAENVMASTNAPSNLRMSRLHTHPQYIGKTNISAAIKPPSSPDLVNAGFVYSHPSNKKLTTSKNYIYTLEDSKPIVYSYDIPEKDIEKFRQVNYKKLLTGDLGESFKISPVINKYTSMENEAQIIGGYGRSGKYLLTNVWTKPRETFNNLGNEYWKGRGEKLLEVYNRNNYPITREEYVSR